jgi:ferredoxin-NADP reductase
MSAKLRCTVTEVRESGAGNYFVELRPQTRVPRFRAGQFLHLTLDEYDPAGGFWPESRVFSIASKPGAETLTIVYSVKGRYTKRMEGSLVPGLEVWVKLPFGDFVIDSRAGACEDVVLIAGGTGVSPFIPFLEDLVPGESATRRIRLYYGLRRPEYLLFGGLLARASGCGAIDLRIWIEDGMLSGDALPPLASVRAGRLDPSLALEESRDLAEPIFFISGPPAMIARFKSALLGTGIEGRRIQIDEWE